jgi:hypothetical protein
VRPERVERFGIPVDEIVHCLGPSSGQHVHVPPEFVLARLRLTNAVDVVVQRPETS